MHFTLILSPKGQYLLKLIDNANKLVPYMVIRQTLKIGNAATMINAMMRVILAKVSVTSVTNWIGLTQSNDDGMNLMQQYAVPLIARVVLLTSFQYHLNRVALGYQGITVKSRKAQKRRRTSI